MGSEAQTKASVKYNRKKDSITIRPDKETGERIRNAAEQCGISATELILTALKPYIEEK